MRSKKALLFTFAFTLFLQTAFLPSAHSQALFSHSGLLGGPPQPGVGLSLGYLLSSELESTLETNLRGQWNETLGLDLGYWKTQAIGQGFRSSLFLKPWYHFILLQTSYSPYLGVGLSFNAFHQSSIDLRLGTAFSAGARLRVNPLVRLYTELEYHLIWGELSTVVIRVGALFTF